MSAPTTATNATFDPFNQMITLLDANQQPFKISMGDLDWMRLYGIRLAINYATQIGAPFTLLLVLLLLTKPEKRRSGIFIMNCLCLFLDGVRSILQVLYLASPYWNPYAFFAMDFSRVKRTDIGTSIAAGTLTTVLVIFIMTSLALQTRVVCVTTPKRQRFLIMFTTGLVALVAIVFRFAVEALNARQIMRFETMEPYFWWVTAQTITQAIAIWFFCVVFTFKLGYALIQRKRLGMRQFGPMQIIFVMGCQTMVVPAVFAVLQFVDSVPELGTQTLTIVCIFLPLSAIWAGVATTDSRLGDSGPGSHQRLLGDQFGMGQSPKGSSCHSSTGMRTASIATKDPKDPDSPITPIIPYMEKSGQIHVDREWSIHNADASNNV